MRPPRLCTAYVQSGPGFHLEAGAFAFSEAARLKHKEHEEHKEEKRAGELFFFFASFVLFVLNS
jgi:hypothetical protein